MLMNGLYSPAGYRLALKVRDNCEFKSEAWDNAQEIVMEITAGMLKNGSTWMYCEVKSEIEDLLEEAESNQNSDADERADELIEMLCYYDFEDQLRADVELPERWTKD